MKIYLIPIFIIILLSGCAQPKPPEWYFKEFNNPNNVCGFGSGKNIVDAKEQAQADLVSSVGVTIGTKYESSVAVSNWDTQTNRKNEITTKNLLKEIINVAVTKQSHESSWGNHLEFVQVCVQKDDIKIVLERSVEKKLLLLQNKELYGKCLSREKRNDYLNLAQETSSELKLLSQYDPNNTYTDKFSLMAQLQGNITDVPIIELKGNNAEFLHLFTPLITSHNIKIDNEMKNRGKLSIQLTGETLRDTTIKNKNVKNYLHVARAILVLRNDCNETLFDGSFKAIDQAKTPQSARLNALNKLIKVIKYSNFTNIVAQY
jgi:hypothetical protein